MAPSNTEVIDLLSSDDEENTSPNPVKRRGIPLNEIKKRGKRENGREIVCIDFSSDDDEDDDNGPTAAAPGVSAVACLNPSQSTTSRPREEEEITQVSNPNAVNFMAKTRKSKKSGETDEDDVAVVGATGPNALADFPHSRENCVTYPHAQNPARHCPNCYCYVCDALASSCPVWQTHCHATYGQAKWRHMREEFKRNGGIVRAPKAAPVAAAARRAPTSSTRENLPPPPPLDVSGRPDLNDYSLRTLLQAVTTVHPVEVTPPAGVFTTQLRHYQKQSLAFMLEEERRAVGAGKTRGGFLADEVGMGKSAVVLALIAANPLPPNQCPTIAQIRQQSRLALASTNDRRVKVKATVIMTSVSLLGQWEDECRKHAPGLRIGRYHPTSGKRISLENLVELDIIISSSTFDWSDVFTQNFEFRRVVVDESHLFSTAPSSAKLDKALAKKSNLRWCVTATPFVSSVAQLTKQLAFLSCGFVNKTYHSHETVAAALRTFRTGSKQTFYTLLDALKTCMVRHAKSQRINGSQALALPSSTTTTMFLDMNAREQTWFGTAPASRLAIQQMSRNGAKTLHLENSLLFRFGEVNQPALLTKVNTLVTELRHMRRTEPSFRVVVFTQSLHMHRFLVAALQREGINTFEFSGSTAAKKRDSAIRSFQSEADTRPAVFVITLRAGNVGITLTAASRVYLMEPSLDPASELQAAGRIHRLGQTKQVQVKKLVFRNSIESNIVKLHDEIAAGRITISDGFFTPEAVKILVKNIRTKA